MKKISAQWTEHSKYEYVNADILVHTIAKRIIELSKTELIQDLSLRDIAEKIGIKGESPQKIKHHLGQLVKMGVFDFVGGNYVRHK